MDDDCDGVLLLKDSLEIPRNDFKDEIDDLRPSLDELLELLSDGVCACVPRSVEALKDAQFRCVSMAAGGRLLRRFLVLISTALFFSSSFLFFLSMSFRSFSAFLFSFLCLSPRYSDQLGERQISAFDDPALKAAFLF